MAKRIEQRRNVKNEEAHKEYLKLRRHPLILSGELTTTDPMMEPIRLGKSMMMGKTYFPELIEHLSEEEKEQLTLQFNEYKQTRGLIIRKSKEAFESLSKYYDTESNALLKTKAIELIELFGSFLSVNQVYKIATQEWGFQMSKAPLRQFKVEYEREIGKKKEEYKNEWNSLKLSHKRGRLEEIQELYYSMKDIYMHKGQNRLDYAQLINTLKLVRDESVDAGQKLELHVSGRIEAVIDHTISTEILKGLPLIEIVLGRVAAKLGTNPSVILERLHSSIYAKFSGIGTESIEDFDDQPIYPSQMVYNWSAIKKTHSVSQPVEEVEYKEVTPEEKMRGKRMLDILKEKTTENKSFLTLLGHSIDKNIEDSKDSEDD